MRRHALEALAAGAGALLITVVIAAPVLLAPSQRIFGADIVGRHHDPFTVMQQFSTPWSLGMYWQPVTDLTGAAIARVTGSVAAYNWLVLLTFPFAALAAYLLARHLEVPWPGALLAALLFAFSPFHIAQAAYHPHIAQTQWLPLYLLALWRCLDDASPVALAWLGAAAVAVTLSNFYGGLIAAVITPIAIASYWLARGRVRPGAARHVAVTVGALASTACAGMGFVAWRASGLLTDRGAVAFPPVDLYVYAAKWWSYLVPPIANPLTGGAALRIWTAAGVGDGLLEQQVSVGWSVAALGLIAIAVWLRPPRAVGHPRPWAVPVLTTIALAALICSLSPQRSILGVTVYRPSALLYLALPMFRSYARFGVIVQLMAAQLAGMGAAHLLAQRGAWPRGLAVFLIVLACAEYVVWPPALSRDVLPTEAHRWVMQQRAGLRILDCAPLTPESSSIVWLSAGRIALAREGVDDCAEPRLAAKAAAAGYTHLLVRDSWQRNWLRARGDADGIHDVARFVDADVFALSPGNLVYTASAAGFWPREHDEGTTWRWMSDDASWTVVSPLPQSRVTLAIDLNAFDVARTVDVRLDDATPQTVRVRTHSAEYRIGPMELSAGSHRLTFHAAAPATVADRVIRNGDQRALSIAVGRWRWELE